MKNKKMSSSLLKLCWAVTACLLLSRPGILHGQEMSECQKHYKTDVDTRKVVVDAIEKVKKGEMWELVQQHISDAEIWLKKADERIAKAKDAMDNGKCNAEVINDLDTGWRWLAEAASAATRAQIAQAHGYGKKK
jgi:hypothetical protein